MIMDSINKVEIRTKYNDMYTDNNGNTNYSSGDDTLKSLETLTSKINEIVEWINSKKDQLL